jgi:DNA invertase Pin-like site-specific DNA recombinase
MLFLETLHLYIKAHTCMKKLFAGLLFACMAEFERNEIRERTNASLAAARARGRKGGRKAKLNDDQVKQIKALLKDPDIKVTDIARQYGVCRATIFNAVGPVKPERLVS